MEILNTYTVTYMPGPDFSPKTAIVIAENISLAVDEACKKYENVTGVFSSDNKAYLFGKTKLRQKDKDLEDKIEKYLLKYDINPTFKGFECLKLAILSCVISGKVGFLSKEVFPRICEETGYTMTSIDRDIRFAISKSKRDTFTIREFITAAFYDIKRDC